MSIDIVLPDPQDMYQSDVHAQLNQEINRIADLAFSPDGENEIGPDGDLVLVSPNGTRYAVRVDDFGNLGTAVLPETGHLQIGAWGSIYTLDGTGSQSLSSGVAAKITQFDSNGLSVERTTPDAANDEITVLDDGIYRISVGVSFVGSANNTDVVIAAAVNDVLGSIRSVDTTGSGDPSSMTVVSQGEIAAGDVITAWVQADKNMTFEVIDAMILVNMISYR